jgi:hypothetical protein
MYNFELGSPTILKMRGWWVENELPKCKHKRGKGLTSRRQSYLQSRINKKNSKDVNYCEIYNAELGGGDWKVTTFQFLESISSNQKYHHTYLSTPL